MPVTQWAPWLRPKLSRIWVALYERSLETISITHAHFDHFYGLSILPGLFPGARAIATPETVNAMQMSFTSVVERLARRMFPGQVPTKLVSPEPYEADTFTLEGHELRIIKQGRTDSPDSTSLTFLARPDRCRRRCVRTTPHLRRRHHLERAARNWIADRTGQAAPNPTMVVAVTSSRRPDSPSTIQDTKRYLPEDLITQKTATSDQELFDQMTELYPHWVADWSCRDGLTLGA